MRTERRGEPRAVSRLLKNGRRRWKIALGLSRKFSAGLTRRRSYSDELSARERRNEKQTSEEILPRSALYSIWKRESLVERPEHRLKLSRAGRSRFRSILSIGALFASQSPAECKRAINFAARELARDVITGKRPAAISEARFSRRIVRFTSHLPRRGHVV